MTRRRFGLVGAISRDWLTYQGRILSHGDPAELAFLVPHGTRVLELPADIPDTDLMPIGEHPQMSAVRFPLRRADFRT